VKKQYLAFFFFNKTFLNYQDPYTTHYIFCSTLELSTFTHESNQTSYRVAVNRQPELSTFAHESNQTSYRVGVNRQAAGRQAGKVVRHGI
jgi:hypothetical protein